MKVKKNSIHTISDVNNPTRLDFPINGFRKGEVSEYHNLVANMAKFKQIEVLSGSIKFYIIPFQHDIGAVIDPEAEIDTLYQNSINFYMMGYHTRRRWVDQELNSQEEILIPKPQNPQELWTQSAETAGYGVRFIPSIYTTSKLKKYAFKANKKDWRTLKANPTSWQQNLPLPGGDSSITVYPQNVKMVVVDFVEPNTNAGSGSTNGSSMVVYVTHTLLVRFKGRLDL